MSDFTIQIDRRSKLLAAARDCFLERGFERTSLDHIIERAGGSRRNIYQLFGDKEGLFHAVLRDRMDVILAGLDHVPPDEARLSDWLETFGLLLLRSMLSREVIATFRQFIALANERQEIGDDAYRRGPAVVYEKVAAYLDRQIALGRLRPLDTRAAARAFVDMIKGDYQLRALMSGHLPHDAEIAAHARTVVSIYLNGVLQAPDSTDKR